MDRRKNHLGYVFICLAWLVCVSFQSYVEEKPEASEHSMCIAVDIDVEHKKRLVKLEKEKLEKLALDSRTHWDLLKAYQKATESHKKVNDFANVCVANLNYIKGKSPEIRTIYMKGADGEECLNSLVTNVLNNSEFPKLADQVSIDEYTVKNFELGEDDACIDVAIEKNTTSRDTYIKKLEKKERRMASLYIRILKEQEIIKYMLLDFKRLDFVALNIQITNVVMCSIFPLLRKWNKIAEKIGLIRPLRNPMLEWIFGTHPMMKELVYLDSIVSRLKELQFLMRRHIYHLERLKEEYVKYDMVASLYEKQRKIVDKAVKELHREKEREKAELDLRRKRKQTISFRLISIIQSILTSIQRKFIRYVPNLNKC
ncbi:hypothetical protein NEAUS03_0711 [Nematocida ausubeli]|nr:hypothetical protein NEAUS03_0711 [Nematocida ausubeli]